MKKNKNSKNIRIKYSFAAEYIYFSAVKKQLKWNLIF